MKTAIANNSKINFQEEGGWDYRDILQVLEEILPKMSIAIDINDDKMIKELVNQIPEDEISKRSNFYEFKFDGRYPAYFAYDKNTVL